MSLVEDVKVWHSKPTAYRIWDLTRTAKRHRTPGAINQYTFLLGPKEVGAHHPRGLAFTCMKNAAFHRG